MFFKDLGLSAELLRAVEKQGYSKATPIQQQAIPLVLEGKDLLAGAQTGTGKTAGFTLPLLQLLQNKYSGGEKSYPKVLVLTPTRELAAQVHESVRDYGAYLPFRSAVIFGGVSINPQKQKLIKGADIVVATPGRLLDHVQQRSVDLSRVETLVLDEADRMLDMGFIHDIRRVMKVIPKQRQTLLFSATFSNDIKKLASEFLQHPAEIQVTPENTATELVSQTVYPVDKKRKRELLSEKIGEENWQQVLIFTRTKHSANKLAEQLGKDGITAAAIHGNKSQGARTRALSDFKAGSVRALVATDIAARGIDIDKLPHVVNFELPNVPEDYIHRIGRTARAGQQGSAISLVCVDELKLLKDIERLLGTAIRKVHAPGYEVDPSIKAEPIQNGSNRGGGRNRPGSGGRAQQGRGRPGASGNAARGRSASGNRRAG
ncbi:DEAD/DEAH box helicase [Haliea sp.]|uniref:DEAD/DEAH box helicase n=1 Tax=Haliea TaxID=475794 RepID=UPI000C6BADF9|nr:DEAD/DEAH box helicase [Haliea sp.]HCD56611.1 ATP-dependent RNA helicase RhlE [Halieaceae bacterium]MAD62116.1 ATP-dependent RNA helicase RhlE [Haliea sp.]MAY93881.1 ATP-dependent RNA helicase RhlE [Haliea sp.]MBK41640.1 ATP-dependent RNA helicase RhlE [Haliea sp.]MBP70902.1 ATP-dependent RNA helicase RhlE [Haliea sp.]